MSIYITKDGQKKKLNVSATDVQLLDIDGRFKSKNLEDALKEVGSGTEENMTRIEERVNQLSSPNLFKNGNLNIWSTGTSFVNPQAWYTVDMWKQNTDLSSGTISINKVDNGMKITISEDAVSNFHYLLSTIQDFDCGLKADLVASIKFKQSKANMLNFYGKVSNDIIGEYQILTQTLTEIKANSYFWFDIVKTGEVEIEYIKLEQGNVATKNNVTTLDMDYVQCYPYYKNISQPNLLINGDFRIWQRGTSFDSDVIALGNKYVADRWQVKLQTGSYILRQSNDAILIQPKQSGWHCNIQQVLDKQDIIPLQGQYVTFSVNINFANAKNIGLVIADDEEIFGRVICKNGINILTCKLPNNRFLKNLRCEISFYTVEQTVADLFISRAKLEIGTLATPFVPKTYSQELADCKRYYEKVINSHNFGVGFVQGSNQAKLGCHYTPKRIAPAVIFSDLSTFRLEMGNTNLSITELVSHCMDEYGNGMLRATVSGGTNGLGCRLVRSDVGTSWIAYDAEIY